MRPAALETRLRVEVGSTTGRFVLEAEFALRQGVLVLFGPSGAGKSLTIRALAGLIRPLRGMIRVGGSCLLDTDAKIFVPAHRRNVGYVPQHHCLFPFRNVIDNVSFGMRLSERSRRNGRLHKLLEELEIAYLADAMPSSLSGGERQRVALARALAVRPRILLLDEPFASIDHTGRGELHRLLRKTLDRHGIPAVFVTHDPAEARALGDRLVRYERGKTVEEGTPETLLPW